MINYKECGIYKRLEKLMNIKSVAWFKEFIDEIIRDRLAFIAAYLCYNLLLAIFPLIIFVLSVFSMLNLNTELRGVVSALNLPEVLLNYADEVASLKSTGVLTVSLLFAINAAASGIKAAMRGINACYGNSTKIGFFKATALSIVLLLSLAAAFAAVAGAAYIDGLITETAGKSSLLMFLSDTAGYVVSFTVITVIVALIYKLSLKERPRLKSLMPGAVFVSFTWIVFTRLFGVFIGMFSGIQRIYGSLAGVIVLLYWINIIGLTLLIGAELNAFLRDRKNSGIKQ